MVKFALMTRRCELTPDDQQALDQHLERLDRELWRIDPDLVHVSLNIERHARREEYLGSVRLVIMNQALPARRNSAPTPAVLIKRAFEDLEEQVERFKARLRGEYTHERKRASLPPEAVRVLEREIAEEREHLDRALAGDRQAFEALVNREMPGLSAAIGSTLIEYHRDPDPEAVEHVLVDVLTTAFAELPHMPARWSLGGWLAWLARRAIKREAAGRAVTQSAEQPVHAH